MSCQSTEVTDNYYLQCCFSSGQATNVEVGIGLLDIHSVEDSKMASSSIVVNCLLDSFFNTNISLSAQPRHATDILRIVPVSLDG